VIAYFKEYANLGTATSQRGEEKLTQDEGRQPNRKLSVHQAVAAIAQYDKALLNVSSSNRMPVSMPSSTLVWPALQALDVCAYRDNVPLPLSLFRPRWFSIEPAIPTGHWRTAYGPRGADTPAGVAVVAAAITAVPEETTSRGGRTKGWWREVEEGRAQSPLAIRCQSVCPLPLQCSLP
jgi:hypothetical protein